MNVRYSVVLIFSVLLAILFWQVPQIDILVSSWFYQPIQDNWIGSDNAIATSIYGLFRYLPFLLVPVFLVLLILPLIKKEVIPKAQRSIVMFLFLSLLIGPGILVHNVFKEGFDRARPKNVEQFEGNKIFTPAFVISQSCQKGCNSFVSGHSAMGFWFMALGWVFVSRRWFYAGIGLGVILSVTRISQGGHFLSDTIFAGILCYLTCRLLA
ncbi:MAG: phosphatase PAP2 family protein, partial [Oleibacter sp.]|nr:phosphatase PAP2 family protein [Thalassolituus sp.]